MELVNWMENCYTEEQNQIKKLQEENKQLKEENKKLKEHQTSEYCNDVCCERRPMMGMSWWKRLGFNSPCKCAYTIQRQEQIKKLKEQNEELQKALDFHILEISKMANEKIDLEEQIDELGDYCKNLSDEPYTQDAYEVFEKITQ